ncbi:MAG: SRPBCC family protein [Pseudomonadota bacterium]
MDKQTQVTLIDELLELHDSRTPYLDGDWERPALNRYLSTDVFARERERIFTRRPHIVAHVSELPGPGDFRTLKSGGRPLLLTRDESGHVRAFYNVCRHRGAKLVREEQGCQHRFSCPYHAWTWNNIGELIAVPHEKTGFPGLNRGEFGLKQIACQEYAGWIWVKLDSESDIDVASHLGDLGPEVLAMDAGDHVIASTTVRDTAANWKILVEGGIESYHFRVAHKNTIAPLFLDNLSTYQFFGSHIRSVLPRATIAELQTQGDDAKDLGKHANVLYTLFPGSQFLMQEDHFVWIQGTPISPDRTVLRISTMIPRKADTEDLRSYWLKHHEFTNITLEEDFVLGEDIQSGMSSGANEHLNFGRFEGALARFNALVEDALN